jgi:DNA-directed RNA polymerase subunit alpha
MHYSLSTQRKGELARPPQNASRRTCRAGKEINDMLWRGFQKPKRLAVDAETLTETFGKFSAQPFERGFGTTIGNALRRTLLSSIEGAAVTAVRVEGVLHEFQSIPGVVEDATDIILNLKQVPFKLAGEGPKALYLRADTPGVVTSGMIEADGDVEILDKGVYIATVSEGGKLEMEMRLKRGRGYISADKNFDASTTSSTPPVLARSPTTTSSPSKCGPMAPCFPPMRSASPPSCSRTT